MCTLICVISYKFYVAANMSCATYGTSPIAIIFAPVAYLVQIAQLQSIRRVLELFHAYGTRQLRVEYEVDSALVIRAVVQTCTTDETIVFVIAKPMVHNAIHT